MKAFRRFTLRIIHVCLYNNPHVLMGTWIDTEDYILDLAFISERKVYSAVGKELKFGFV